MTNMKVWTCKNGDKIRIRDLDNGHLLNIIQFLEDQYEELQDSNPFPSFQGDMAQYYAMQAWERDRPGPIENCFTEYLDLVEEAKKRKLL